jgi:hypothetical protein
MADIEQPTKTWLYSLIQLRLDSKAMPIVFGIVLFQPDDDFIFQLAINPAQHLPDADRWMMSARGLIKRLRVSNARTTDEIKAFIAKEANEMQIVMPSSYIVKDSISAIDNLRALAFLHFPAQ